MVNSANPLGGNQNALNTSIRTGKTSNNQNTIQKSGARDSVRFGLSSKISSQDAQKIVLERAYERLRSTVMEAREALGIPEGAIIDTSPEATAGRIVDFALGFFDRYAKNNGLEDNEEGRRIFANFIGNAIMKGIDEARGILNAMSALNPEISGNIDKTSSIIAARLENFITNGL